MRDRGRTGGGGRARAYGLMAGLTLGFAVWGSVPAAPGPWVWGVEKAAEAEAEEAAKAKPESARGPLDLHALSAVLIDGDSGRILYGKEADVFRPMASTTKIMTCILALENGSPKDICTVSKNAAAQPKVRLGAAEGTEFALKDLLYSLMLESHNDTAVVIAEHIAGTVEEFTAMMNQKARDIGCKDTLFLTPNGLDAEYTDGEGIVRTHGTTAADLAAILKYCIMESPKREEFLAVTRTANYSFRDGSGRHSYACVNHNAFLNMMEGVLTGKTGFTGKAGYSYVAALRDGDRTYVAVLLGSGWPPHKGYKWEDVRKLFNYGKKYFTCREIYEKPVLPELPVTGGVREGAVPLMEGLPPEGRSRRLLMAEDETVRVELQTPGFLQAPVLAGDPAGYVVYRLGGETVWAYPLLAGASMEAWNYPDCLKKLVGKYLSMGTFG